MAQHFALVKATSMTGLHPVCALHDWSVAALVGPLRNRPYKARSRRARAHCVASDDERSVWAPCANVARLARRRRLGVEAGRVGALVQVLRKAGCCHLQRKAVAGQLASVGRSPTQHQLLRVRCTCWDCRELDLQEARARRRQYALCAARRHASHLWLQANAAQNLKPTRRCAREDYGALIQQWHSMQNHDD